MNVWSLNLCPPVTSSMFDWQRRVDADFRVNFFYKIPNVCPFKHCTGQFTFELGYNVNEGI
jgi:hypothetical protein